MPRWAAYGFVVYHQIGRSDSNRRISPVDERLRQEKYKGYSIKFNQVPEGQFEYSFGFGWAFEIYLSESRFPLCIVVLKSLNGGRTLVNLEHGLELGRKAVHLLIGEGKFEKKYYCYQWEPNGSTSQPMTEVDCDKISSPQFRSPLSS